MATRVQAVTGAPTALAGTVSGTRYTVQNLAAAPVFVAVAVAAEQPDADSLAFAVPSLGFVYPTPGAGELVWVWGPDGSVAYEESS